MPIRVARIFNTYGPRMQPNDGRVVSNFIVQALRGEPITIYGDGSQTRSFCFVDDLIEGLMRLMAAPDEVTGPINLGNPARVHRPGAGREGHRDDRFQVRGSSSRPCRRTIPASASRTSARPSGCSDWQPKVPLEEGLERTIAYFERRLHGDG